MKNFVKLFFQKNEIKFLWVKINNDYNVICLIFYLGKLRLGKSLSGPEILIKQNLSVTRDHDDMILERVFFSKE